ncbi:CHAT domain-containing protein [Chroococcus sp. FPU101]|uniref:CHAT domain-containing protein n=1 Tax=Chroococcus sp. FPU101 TaxID=1974212 RepID=UPI001A8D7FC8|nr:CHAT domain-containing protein [Chroococcus sp. FPU101]GFE68838.1 Tetratricopeptide domain protein [Chroococcus sp. FPU101]
MFNRLIKWLLIALISLTIALNSTLVTAQTSTIEQEQQGINFYQNYQSQQAIQIWEQVLQVYQEKDDQFSQARVLSNLALAYQQKGEWEKAEQALAQSLNLIKSVSETSVNLSLIAQILNNQGLIQLGKGQAEQALETWQKASQAYAKSSDKIGYLRSQVNQAKALDLMGLHSRACQILAEALQVDLTICLPNNLDKIPRLEHNKNIIIKKLKQLENNIDSVKFTAWHTLAKELRETAQPELSQIILQNLLSQANSSEDQAIILLSLGKIYSSEKNHKIALDFYQKAEIEAVNPLTKVLILLQQLELFQVTEQWTAIPDLVKKISSKLEELPITQDAIYAQINFISHLILIKKTSSNINLPSWLELAKISANIVQQAKIINSPRIESYALGNLGAIYEQTKQLDIAQTLTEQALIIAQSLNTPEIIYRWQWQLGRILHLVGDHEKAIFVYNEAVNTLELLKKDIVYTNQNIQFSFTSTVEPVYRELVSLLLQPDTNGNIPQENLIKARSTIESLQLAELDNFLQENCLKAQPKSIDELARDAAVIYPIILPDRLEIILSLPQQPLKRYVTPVPKSQLTSTALKLRQTLVIRSRRDFYEPAQNLYQWLIRPLEQDLKNAQIETLVFVLDGALRNIPVGTLYDGKQYLIEKYETSLTPGLQLLNPQPLQQTSLYTLGVGITQARKGFSPLYYVAQELESIQENVKSRIMLNQAFTFQDFQEQLLDNSFPIVHIATHSQFSSNFEQTFLLSWDKKINVRQLESLLKGKSNSQNNAIELLVLSACETATGDEKATLGLAGIAVRSGARSTIATLWSVNDEASAELMRTFYQTLAVGKKTKSQSLREAKLKLLSNAKYRHPFYWSAYILLGNWL